MGLFALNAKIQNVPCVKKNEKIVNGVDSIYVNQIKNKLRE